MTLNPAAALLRVAALLVVCGSWAPIGGLAADAPAPPAVTVSQPIQRELVEWDEYTGQFAATEYVEIRARVSGYLTEIHFEDGQIGQRGRSAVRHRSRGPTRRRSPRRGRSSPRPARRSNSRPASSSAPPSCARRISSRQAPTTSASRISRSRRPPSKSAKAAIRSAELNVEFTQITAPLDGADQQSPSQHRQSRSAAATARRPRLLTTIVSLDPIYFNFDMSEGDYLAYQRATAAGQADEARDNSPRRSMCVSPTRRSWPRKGRLNFVDNQVDRGAGTIRARATFANPDFFLTPGQFGRIRMPGLRAPMTRC